MANYAVDPELLKPYLPKGVELDYYNDKTYVSLVGFMFTRCRLFGVPVPLFKNFEEVNLRFYVRRKMDKENRRGVVFIGETVPFQAVAWLANKLYKEHYMAIPTRHNWEITGMNKRIEYSWLRHKKWNHISVNTSTAGMPIKKDSVEEFIFEHYYGYTKIDENIAEEYKIEHPRWQIFNIDQFEINCDFEAMYGSNFAHLRAKNPDSVMLAEGSAIAVAWKRVRL